MFPFFFSFFFQGSDEEMLKAITCSGRVSNSRFLSLLVSGFFVSFYRSHYFFFFVSSDDGRIWGRSFLLASLFLWVSYFSAPILNFPLMSLSCLASVFRSVLFIFRDDCCIWTRWTAFFFLPFYLLFGQDELFLFFLSTF